MWHETNVDFYLQDTVFNKDKIVTSAGEYWIEQETEKDERLQITFHLSESFPRMKYNNKKLLGRISRDCNGIQKKRRSKVIGDESLQRKSNSREWKLCLG